VYVLPIERLYSFVHSFIHSFMHLSIYSLILPPVRLTTVPHPLPKPVLHTVLSSASSSSLQCPHFFLMPSVAAHVSLLFFPSLLTFRQYRALECSCFSIVFFRGEGGLFYRAVIARIVKDRG